MDLLFLCEPCCSASRHFKHEKQQPEPSTTKDKDPSLPRTTEGGCLGLPALKSLPGPLWVPVFLSLERLTSIIAASLYFCTLRTILIAT
jgi:hypothetical protein